MDIFSRIQKNYPSIESIEALRSGGELLLNRKARRSNKFKPPSNGDHSGKPLVIQPKFPPNTGNLIPYKYYIQFKE